MAEPESEKTSRSAKPLSLVNVTTRVFAILQERGTTSFDEVAEEILAKMGTDTELSTPNEQRTLRRRVYDVLNVLCAAGIVAKDNRTITFQTANAQIKGASQMVQTLQARVEAKRNSLLEKTKLLIYHKLLMNRNSKSDVPQHLAKLPLILLGFGDVDNGSSERELDGSSLVIVTRSPPLLFSPMNVLECIGFTPEEQLDCLKQLNLPQNECNALQSLLFPSPV